MIYYYRYTESLYSESKIGLVLHTYPVLKETPKGVWIDNFGYKRFVLSNAKKKYANPTKEEALESYHARKKRQIKILKAQLERAEAALRLRDDNKLEYI